MSKRTEFYLQKGAIHNHLELLETSEACLWFIDKNYNLLSFNSIYSRHMQIFANVVPNIGDKDIVLACFPKAFADGILEMYQQALSGEVVKAMDKGFNEDGTETDVMMIFKPVYDDDSSLLGVSCMRRDVSDYLKTKKNLEEKENRIAEMLWQQSHLYRGPLATAMGIVNLLIEETSDRTLSDKECKDLIIAMRDKLFELDQVIHHISKESLYKAFAWLFCIQILFFI